jgi:hypothetical protein
MDTEVNVGKQGPAATRPRGWWSRNWKWFVPAVILAAIVVGGFCAYRAVFGLRSSEAYQLALKKVQTDASVTGALGEPICEAYWPLPSAQNDTERGESLLLFQVAGPKGKASVSVRACRIDEKWGLRQVEVTPEGGKRMLLELGAESGLEAAKPFEAAPTTTETKPEGPPPKMEFKIPE